MAARSMFRLVLLSAVAALVAAPAAAYIGPGVGLGVIGAIFAAIVGFLMIIAGLVWYPVKVLLRKRREKKAAAPASSGEPAQ